MRDITVSLDDALDLIACAQDYGYADDVFLYSMGQWTGLVTDEEIEEFANTFISPENRERGYTEEDVEHITDILTEWRDRYANGKTEESVA